MTTATQPAEPTPRSGSGSATPAQVRLVGTIDGAEVEITLNVKLTNIRAAIAFLRGEGFRSRVRFDRTPDGTPICPIHGVPMPVREKQGDSWHSHKITHRGQELYCRGVPGSGSEGYDA